MLTPDRRQEGTKKMNRKTTFTPLYDWVAARGDLSLLEKLIICRVLRYGEGGCFESYSTIAKAFHVDRRQLIRTIQSLVKKQWLAVLTREKNGRVFYREYWVNPDMFSAGPLFDLPAVRESRGGLKPPADVSKSPEEVVSDHPSIHVSSYNKNKDKIQQEIKFLSEVMTDKAKPLSGQSFERRRQRVRKDLFAADEAAKAKKKTYSAGPRGERRCTQS